MAKCGKRCEVYSRVVGYHRPIQNWNHGKKAEFSDRVEFQESVSMKRIDKSSFGAKQTPVAEESTNVC